MGYRRGLLGVTSTKQFPDEATTVTHAAHVVLSEDCTNLENSRSRMYRDDGFQ